jgi:hypothetical protein
MRNAVAIAIGAAIGIAAASAEAVVLNPRGTGQVLIYPYYTVNAGFGTLLSVVNTTAQGKALKVHIREGYNGRSVLDFNLYLSPFDAWVAQVFSMSGDDSGGAAIATNDNSCTVPKFLATFGPAPGEGGTVSFSNAGYSGSNADGGPAALSRTREGYVEIIEMGTLSNDHHSTLSAITHGSSGVPSNCPQVVDAWSTGGYWSTDATTDIDPPDGGLFGAESIINVGEGLLYTVNAEAIDGFSVAIQHSLPGSGTPDLASASKSADGTVSAFVPIGSSMVEAKYDHPEDAISALFMADALYNEYVVDAGLGAMTDWVVTFPTKRLYTDSTLVSSAAARTPFDAIFGADANAAGTSCSPVRSQRFSREELTTSDGIDFTVHPYWTTTAACYATSVFSFSTGASVLASKLVRSGDAFPSLIPRDMSLVFPTGHALIDFTKDSTYVAETRHALVSANGISLRGLPALGFAAIDYVNGNAAPGLLANYSGAYPHRAHAACIKASDGSPCQ